MRYLTIDTTTKITALSLANDGKVISEGFLHTGKTHSERLIPMLDQMLHAADWELGDLDCISVVRGPGSFTGIRIGIATAQGLAQVLKIPLLGITSLDTLSWAGYGREEETVVILDARKNEWYYARYRWSEKRQTIEGPMAVSPECLISGLSQGSNHFYFVGDAVPGAKGYLKEALGDKAVLPLEYQYLPRGAYAAYETWERQQEQRNFPAEAFGAIEPLYIRISEAEVNFRKKHLEDS